MRELEARDDLLLGGESLPILKAAYQSEVAYTDQAISRLLEAAHIDPTESIIVITADHGEEFRDHRHLGHRSSLYSELVRVPLVVSSPIHSGGRVVAEPLSHVDLYPTLLELAALPPRNGLSGASLVKGKELVAPVSRPVLSSVLYEERFIHSLTQGKLRVIRDEREGRLELYDEVDDLGDHQNIVDAYRVEADTLSRVINDMIADRVTPSAKAPVSPMSEEQIEQLRALGYVTD